MTYHIVICHSFHILYSNVILNEIRMFLLYCFVSPFSKFYHLTDYEVNHPERHDIKYNFLSLTSYLIQELLTTWQMTVCKKGAKITTLDLRH
jgi:hypothetical protein